MASYHRFSSRRRPRVRIRVLWFIGLLAAVVAFQMVMGLGLGVERLLGVAGGVGTSGAPPTVELHRTYTVQSGDSIGSIAIHFGVSQVQLEKWNHISNPNRIYPGQRLFIPAPYHPTQTRRLIESTAKRLNVDPVFAAALAYQESGFDENLISDTGAIGVMQVEPSTALLVARDTGQPIDLGVESDNIMAGVYWLGYLTRYYGGNERKAAAAYYEGQRNLAEHGYLQGTAQYVADVMSLKRSFEG